MIVNLMRANQRWMMIIISTLVLISFVWFYSNRAHFEGQTSDQVGRIYGRNLSNADFERAVRQVATARDLLLLNLMQPDVSSQRDLGSSALNLLVLQQEARNLGIEPSEAEVEEASKKIPAFQAPGGGGFDPTLYANFVDKKLGPRGFSDQQITDLVRVDLQVGKLRQLFDSTVSVTPAEVRTSYEQVFTKTNVSVIRLKAADFAAAVEPTAEEIKKYYDEQKDHFQFPEKRKVQYVVFGLDEAQKNLTGKERIEAMKPFATQTEQFLEKVLDAKGKADFAAVAAELKAPVKETPEFEESENAVLPEASIPGFVPTAFRLSPGQPDSDPIDTPTAYYILHLKGITPVKPMTLEEARPKIVAAIKEDRSRAAMTAKAEEIRAKITEALKAGRSLADAAKEAGQKMEDVPALSPAEPPPEGTDISLISDAALALNKGGMSKFITAPDGGLFVYVRGRDSIDEKKFDTQKEMLTQRLRLQKRRFAFMEWLRASREAAHIKLGQGEGEGEDSQG
jgi:parvulin-like peptidyl-prolyl isomerase